MQRREPAPRQELSADAEAETDSTAIEPGNSVHGAPTHGNTPVNKFFTRPQGKGHGRPQGQGGPRRGAGAQGKGPRPFGAPGGQGETACQADGLEKDTEAFHGKTSYR